MFKSAADAEMRVKSGGTGFVVGKEIPGSAESGIGRRYVPYLVSNRHVVLEGSACVASINKRGGGAPTVLDIDQNDWVPHPHGDDVAATCILGLVDPEHHEMALIPDDWFITPEINYEYDIGPGDEVFMVGRFINHQGLLSNLPALRFGSISLMPEPIKHPNYPGFEQESFAVEMRSRTGFSGSPVTVYRTLATVLADIPNDKCGLTFLLGVNWGYIFDEAKENTWLNGVVPAWKIRETLDVPTLQAAQERGEQRFWSEIERSGA